MSEKVTENEKNETRQELAKLLAQECESFQDVNNLLKLLFAETVEEILEREMDEHLGYDNCGAAGNNSGNSRNGHTKKTINTYYGKSEIRIPRDRKGKFEPKIIGKYQTKITNIENQAPALYVKGVSALDVEEYLYDIYGIHASPALISKITDKIFPEAKEWRSRPLESVYPIVFFGGTFEKVRRNDKAQDICSYIVLGINSDGIKEVLGFWTAESECDDLKKRGVREIFIACHDNLNGAGEAINTVFPKTQRQLCIIHQIRSSTKSVSFRDTKPLTADLKRVYDAESKNLAELRLAEFAEKWDKKYPQVSKSWLEDWEYLSEFFKYPIEIRKLIYTTNAIEGFHRLLRKYTNHKDALPNDGAFFKSYYLAVAEISRKWSVPIRNWSAIRRQLGVFFARTLPVPLIYEKTN